MKLLTGKDAAKRVKGFISARQQVHGLHVDLTADRIYTLTPTGTVDFGGNELLPAEPISLSTHKKHSQDRYEWWTLLHGAYLVECNEVLKLGADDIALLEPHERLQKAGASHATRYLRGTMDPIYLLLEVPTGKVEIKQNARISTLRVFSLGGKATPPARKKTSTKSKRSKKSKKSRKSARPTSSRKPKRKVTRKKTAPKKKSARGRKKKRR